MRCGDAKRTLKLPTRFVRLSHAERKALVAEFADEIGRWSDALLFGDVQEKTAHTWGDRERIREYAFEQVVTRFQTFLSSVRGSHRMGMLVRQSVPWKR